MSEVCFPPATQCENNVKITPLLLVDLLTKTLWSALIARLEQIESS